MKSTTRLFVLIACLIVGFDVLGAAASKFLHFDYNYLLGGSCVLFVLSGYLGFKHRQLLGGFQAGLVAGFVDSIAELSLVVAINPQLRESQLQLTIFVIPLTVALITLLGGLLGLASAVIAKAIILVQTDSVTRQ